MNSHHAECCLQRKEDSALDAFITLFEEFRSGRATEADVQGALRAMFALAMRDGNFSTREQEVLASFKGADKKLLRRVMLDAALGRPACAKGQMLQPALPDMASF